MSSGTSGVSIDSRRPKFVGNFPVREGEDDQFIPESNQSVNPEGCMYDEQSTSTTNLLHSLCIPNDSVEQSTVTSRR